MKKFFKILAVSLFLVACGDNRQMSTVAGNSNESFSTTYSNNTDKDFDVKTSSADLSITKSYVHVPTNNLYGNRYIVVDFNVKNKSFDKKIWTAFDGKWFNSVWTNVPEFGPYSGQSYVRYLSSADGRDMFSLIIHDTIRERSPTVELKVSQGTDESYVKIQLRAKDLEHNEKMPFSVARIKDEISIEAISAQKVGSGTALKIDVDVKDLDTRKLFQIECFECTGGDVTKKTLSFISKAETRSKSGAVFHSKENGREKISLYILLPNSGLNSIRSLRLTYLAPGYYGTPTHGAYDGIFGTPHTLSVRIGN